MNDHRQLDFFWEKIFVLLATLSFLASLAPIWSGKYLPFTDIPQNLAQASVIRNFSNPALEYSNYYLVKLFTPYGFPVALCALLCYLFPPLIAVKILLSLTIWLYPASLAYLFRRSGGSRRWAVFGFPLAYNSNLFWGHLSFYFAIPWGLVLWGLAIDESESPARWKEVALAAGMSLLFFLHLFVWAFCWLAVLILLFDRKNLKGICSLFPSLLLILGWMFRTAGKASIHVSVAWAFGWRRSLELIQLLVGLNGAWQFLTVLAMLFSFQLLNKKASVLYRRWLIAAISLLVFFCALETRPVISVIAERMTVFVVPALMICFVKANSDRKKELLGLNYLMGVFLILMGINSYQIVSFNREALDFAPVLNRLKAGKRLIANIENTDSSAGYFIPYEHFGAYYQVERGGFFEFSFANSLHQIIERKESVSGDLMTAPDLFEQRPCSSGYDYYLLRSNIDENGRLLPKLGKCFALNIHSGSWWLFERK